MKYLIAVVCCMFCFGCVTNSKYQEELIQHHNWEDRAHALAAEVEEIQGRHKYEMRKMWQLVGGLRQDSAQTENYIRRIQQNQPNGKLLQDLRYFQKIADSLHVVVVNQQKIINSSPPAQPKSQSNSKVNTPPKSNSNSRKNRLQELESFVLQKVMKLPKGKANIRRTDKQIRLNFAEELLFESGSIKIEAKGSKALHALAEIIENFPEFKVFVIGHTDNIPIRKKGVRDNWDLSVLRATSITRSLVRDFGFSPSSIIPAGRGEFEPISEEDSEYARAKNRRIEIIITEDLQLFYALSMRGK